MYTFLHELLSDKKGGEIFVLFGGWHFFHIALTLIAATAVFFVLKNKSETVRRKITKFWIHAAFGLYVADFFFMPLAYGEIDIEKLPFHACTAMCVMCFLSYHSCFLSKLRVHFALLGFVSNLIYLIYPAGVMWHGVHPLSYRVVQTLLFHAVMTVYGLMALVYEEPQRSVRRVCPGDLAVLVGMTGWALLGNLCYNGESERYSHFFNWFFVVRDPFYVLPENIAPFIMPLLNIAVFFAVEVLIRAMTAGIRRYWREKQGRTKNT